MYLSIYNRRELFGWWLVSEQTTMRHYQKTIRLDAIVLTTDTYTTSQSSQPACLLLY